MMSRMGMVVTKAKGWGGDVKLIKLVPQVVYGFMNCNLSFLSLMNRISLQDEVFLYFEMRLF